MVTSKSNKVKRLTYAERVLGAFSVAQKESRRSAIHIATLRATVKKTAQARKDKLGPQWSSWIGRAVHSLAEKGILEHGDTTGSLVMTPTGKKAIAEAHKALNLGPNVEPSPSQQDAIWEQVTHSPSRGTKRKQRKSVAAQDESSDDEDDVLVPLTRARAKRPRTSLRQSIMKKPISQMNKGELKSELKTLQKAHDDAAHADNTDELKEELAERQEEIDSVRLELAELRRQLGGDDATTHMGSSSPIRSSTPGLQFDRASSPLTSSSPVAGPSRFTVFRTGSFISQLSKQPTPAPSDGGADMGYIDMDDVFGNPSSAMNELQPAISTLATPHGTPSKGQSDEIIGFKLMLENAKQAESKAHDKVVTLEQTVADQGAALAERDAAAESLRREVQATISERADLFSKLETAVASKSSIQVELNAVTEKGAGMASSLEEAASALQLKHAELATADEEINALRDQLATSEHRASRLGAALLTAEELRTRLRVTTANAEELSRVVTGLEALKVEQAESIEDQSVELSRAQQALYDAQSRIEVLSKELVAKDRRADELSAKLSASQASVVDLTQQLHVLCEIRTELLEEQKQTSILKGTVQELSVRVTDAELATKDLQASLEASKTEVFAFSEQLVNSNDARATVAAQLEAAQLRVTASSAESAGLRVVVSDGQAKSSRLENDLGTATARAQEAETRVAQLKEARMVDNATIGKLKQGVVMLKQAQMAAFEDLDIMVQDPNATASSDLDAMTV